MRKFLRLALFAVTTMVLPLFTPAVSACQCIETELPVCAQYWRAKVVFTALVTDITPPADKDGFYKENTVVSLAVENVYRGNIGNIAIDVQGDGADCQIEYQKGGRYLIYAFDYNPNDNRIQTSACSRTTEVTRADEDFAYIRSLPQKEMIVHGKVLDAVSIFTPFKGIQIEAQGGGKTYRTVTNAEGRFVFRVAEAGKYRVRAIGLKNSDFLTYRMDANWHLRKGRPVLELEEQVENGGCVYVELRLAVDRSGQNDKRKQH
jgi:hypothetical protein